MSTPCEHHNTVVLVGRDREQAFLREALEGALAGRGRLVLLGGEAGMGKTSLAEALLHEAQVQGAFVLVGRCFDLSETPPYGPWSELFAQTPRVDSPPSIPALTGDGTVSQTALFAQVRAFLDALATKQPLVLLLEDLHWADQASLDLLRALARGLADLPLLLLATYRLTELTRRHPLYQLLPVLVREARAARLDLRPLDDEGLRALVRVTSILPPDDEGRLVTYLHGRAEGNPFFASELLRTLVETGALHRATSTGWALGDLADARVPPLLRQVIDARVDRLGEATRSLLAAAATIGQVVPLTLWATVADVAEAALLGPVELATEAGLLLETPDGSAIHFAHALIREALYEGTAAIRRRTWHLRAGEALVAMAQPDPDAVASHLRRAGDPRATEWLVRAGLRARRADAWFMAAERFATAATLLESVEPRARERGWLLFFAAFLLRFSDNTRAIDYLDTAERAALAAGDRVLLAYARYQRGPSLCMRGEIRRGLVDMARGVAGLDALPAEYHLRVSEELALATVAALVPEEGYSPPARPPNTSVQPTSTPQRGVLAHWLGQAGRYRESLATGESFTAAMTAALGERRLQMFPCVTGHLGLGHAYAAFGRPTDAQREFTLARHSFDALGEAFMVEFAVWSELLLVVLPYQADDVTGRTGLVAEATRAWGQAGGRITTATHASQAELFVALLDGRWAVARELAQAGLAATTAPHRQGATLALGLLARHQGEPADAWARVRALFPAGATTEPGNNHFPVACMAQALAVDLALDAGDLAEAARWLATQAHWLDWSGASLWQADHLRLRARHAWLSGDLASARAHAETSLAHAADPHQPLTLLSAHRLLGELDTATDRHTEAADHLAAALALADACAAPFERALTVLALAELHVAEGRREEAIAALEEARDTFALRSARTALARADRLAAGLALVRAEVIPPTYPNGLTAREIDVLRLVAAGRSNREMATMLARSERTIERHLENIYRKIDGRSKADATAFAFRHGLA